jgi:hypothetical protein
MQRIELEGEKLIPEILLLSLMIHCNGSAAKTYNKALIGQPCLIPFLIEKYLVKKPY